MDLTHLSVISSESYQGGGEGCDEGRNVFDGNTYKSTIEACLERRRFPIEIMYASSTYENQIEIFRGSKDRG